MLLVAWDSPSLMPVIHLEVLVNFPSSKMLWHEQVDSAGSHAFKYPPCVQSGHYYIELEPTVVPHNYVVQVLRLFYLALYSRLRSFSGC